MESGLIRYGALQRAKSRIVVDAHHQPEVSAPRSSAVGDHGLNIP